MIYLWRQYFTHASLMTFLWYTTVKLVTFCKYWTGSTHPQINLTSEQEVDLELHFLDVLVHRNRRSFSINMYRKPTHSHKYLNYKSSHSPQQMKNGFRGLVLRAHRLLKNHPKNLRKELNYLTQTFTNQANGYPRGLVLSWLNSFQRELRANPQILIF